MAPDAESLLRHAGGIRALLRGLLSDDARIDDVLQDTWVAALAKGPRPGVPLGPWLKRVALNFALRLRRGEARRTARERAAARPDETPETRFDLQRDVVEELARLEEPYRSTLILRFFEGLSPAEIAEQRGMPPATVRSHLKRGLDRIRERLDRSHGSRGAWGAALLPWLGTRKAVATGVIVMSAKTKLALVAALVLAMAGGTTGVLVWRGSPDPAETARATASRAAPAIPDDGHEAAASGTPPPAESERSLTLRGRIVDAATKRVVPNTPVRIALVGEERKLEVVTNDAGEFSGTSPILSEAGFGTYFRAPGIIFRWLAIEAEGYAVRGSPEPTLAGEDTLVLGDVEVSRGITVAGRVVRRDRTGIAGAVLLLSFESPSLFPPAYAFPVGRSGADGSFVLDHPVPVTDRHWPWMLMALGAEGLGWQALDVLPGKDRIDGVEIVVDPAAPLEVTVTDSTGAPVADAYVRAEPRFKPFKPDHETEHDHFLSLGRREDVGALFSAKTGADGRVALAHLPLPGPYDIVAAAKGYALGWQDNVALDRDQRRSVTVRLERMRLCAVSGTVLAMDGAPVAGASVGPRGIATVVTDDLGRFRVEALEPAWQKVWLVASAEGFATLDREVQLASDHDIEGIEIRLERAMPIGGRVVEQDGRPVAGVYLDLLRNREQLRPDVDHTGADGRFVFKDATAGPWKLRVIAPQDQPEWEGWRELEVRGGDNGLEIVLRRLRLGTTKLLARVVEAGTGRMLDAAGAFLMRRDWQSSTEYADPPQVERRSGEVAVVRLHPDAWRLWVHVPGFAPGYVDFTVGEGQAEARPEVRMGHAGRIVGRVAGIATEAKVWTSPAGSDLAPGAEYETDGRIRGWAKIGDDGTFVIGNLAPGPTTIKLDASGFLGTATVDVPSGGEAQIEITATPAARLRFRSKDPVPEGTEAIEFCVAQGGGDWACVMRLGGVAGKPLSDEETLPAGRTRWRVVFESDGRVRTQEGVVDLVVGQTADVVVPIELE